ncbi:MAG: hypothetical protein QOE18_1325, partial [Chloroflexota bacterium]|nr:hypothetical protein [Chloroflexota bacterium]
GCSRSAGSGHASFDLLDDVGELVGQRAGEAPLEDLDDAEVVPELLVRIGDGESLPHHVTLDTQVGEYRARVVELVAGRHEEHIGVGIGVEVTEVAFLSLAPWRLGSAGDGDGIAAGHDDARHTLPELSVNAPVGCGAVDRVLDGVVQECGDGHLLIGAVLESEGAHRHHVGHVGDAGPLAQLPAVDLPREGEGSCEAIGQRRRGVGPIGHADIVGPVRPAERSLAREREWRVRFYLGHRLPGGFWGGVSTYARRPHHAVRQAARATGGIGCAGYVVLGVVLVLSIAYWYISVPVLVLTAIAVGVTVHRQHVRQRQATAAAPPPAAAAPGSAPPAMASPPPQVLQRQRSPPLTMPADTFKVGSLVHLEKDGTRATYFVDHGRTPDEIVLKRVSSPRAPNAAPDA